VSQVEAQVQLSPQRDRVQVPTASPLGIKHVLSQKQSLRVAIHLFETIGDECSGVRCGSTIGTELANRRGEIVLRPFKVDLRVLVLGGPLKKAVTPVANLPEPSWNGKPASSVRLNHTNSVELWPCPLSPGPGVAVRHDWGSLHSTHRDDAEPWHDGFVRPSEEIETAKAALVRLFESNLGLAHFELPDGGPGRPGDNLYQLTFVAARQLKLLVELDNQLLLVFTEPRIEAANDSCVRIAYRQLTFDWQEYVNLRPRISTYGEGILDFTSQPRP
jgi:hypothetical protein